MIEKITRNWLWKVLSLVLAFFLWVVVVNYNDPYITKSFEDIPVEKRYKEAITSQGLAITYLDGESVDVTVGGNRSRIDKLGIEELSAYVDMNLVSITGAIDIDVDSPDQVDVLEKTPNNMQISMEHIKTELKDIQVFYDGELAEEHIKLNPMITPNQVEVTGPESKLAMVASVIVNVKIDNASDDITVFVSPKVQDSDGNDVSDITLSNNQIEVKIPIQKIKTIPVGYVTTGSIGEDYRLMSIGLDVNTVMIRGEAELIDDFSRLVISDINLSGLTDSNRSMNINLTEHLPEGISLYGSESIANLELDIRALTTKELAITSSDITVSALEEGLQFKFVDEFELPIEVKGIDSDLNSFEVDDLRPSINLRSLGAGEHEVTIELFAPNGIEILTEVEPILVELSEAPEVETTGDASDNQDNSNQ